MPTFSTFVHVLIRLIVLVQSYDINLLFVAILLLLKYGWFSPSKNRKNSQYNSWHSFFALETSFFGFPDSFYIKTNWSIFLQTLEGLKLNDFLKLPKFAQIFDWWRHTGIWAAFEMSRLIFLNSAVNFI